ncbi:MAG: acetate kinase [Patescibacteria group bacterium]
MDSILVFNIGSSSIRYHRYAYGTLELLHEGHKDFLTDRGTREDFMRMFRECVRDMGDISTIKGIGHRVVHGGNRFVTPTLVTTGVIAELKNLNHLAPLHNPWNLLGLEACETYLPGIPNVAVFDTGFFAHLPALASRYAIPAEFSGYRRFGFHGISHATVADQLSRKLKKPLKQLTFINCHLGSGSSIALIEKGEPVDTSMGYTPLEGLVMMTRCGDVDPGIIFDLVQNIIREAQTLERAQREVQKLVEGFYRSAGLKALSGYTSFLDILAQKKIGVEQAVFAFDYFVRRGRKYIGAYAALVPHLDALTFTGAIGAGNPTARKAIIKNLACVKGVPVYVFPPAEEVTIAREVMKVIGGS